MEMFLEFEVNRRGGISGTNKSLFKKFQTGLDSDFKSNTRVPVVGTDSRIKHLAFRSQVFFLAGGSTHLEPCVSPDR